MTPDTPAMDEKGLLLALDVFEIETKINSKSIKHGLSEAIAAYLAATALSFKHCDGCDGHECTDRCKYPEPETPQWFKDRQKPIKTDQQVEDELTGNAGLRGASAAASESLKSVSSVKIGGSRPVSTSQAGDLGAAKVKGLQWASEPPYRIARPFAGIHYATEVVWPENGKSFDYVMLSGPTVGTKRFSSLSDAQAAAQADFTSRILSALSSSPVGEMDGWRRTTEHEVLFIASYCGDDNTACSESRPCPTCLGMANVYIIPDGTPIKYQRQLSPDWLGNKHLEKLGARQIGKAPRVRKPRASPQGVR